MTQDTRMIWAQRGLRWSYCAFIAWMSVQALLSAHGAQGDDRSHGVGYTAGYHTATALWMVLSGVELLAIAAFLFEKFEVPACIVLTGVYAIAAVWMIAAGKTPIGFVYFAATAIYLVLSRRAQPAAAHEST